MEQLTNGQLTNGRVDNCLINDHLIIIISDDHIPGDSQALCYGNPVHRYDRQLTEDSKSKLPFGQLGYTLIYKPNQFIFF